MTAPAGESLVVNGVRTTGKMYALRVNKGAREARLELVDIPKPGPHDVCIKVVSAILAPDVFGLVEAGRLPQAPTTLGHKVAGIIEEVGDAVENLKPGQRVRLDPNLSCGSCNYCRTDRDQMCLEGAMMGFFAPGKSPLFDNYHERGLAEYVRAPSSQVDILPDNISFDVGAKIHDLANALRAFKVAAPPVGSTVLITAATGAMGTAIVKLASFFGVSHLILVGRSSGRLEAVAGMTPIQCSCIGLDTLGEDWPASRSLGKKVCEVAPNGVDAIIDFSPTGVDLWQVTEGLSLNGTFVTMGGNWSIIPIPARLIGLKCWNVLGTRNHSRGDSEAVMKLLEGGQLNVDELVTHQFKLGEIEQAIQQLKDRSQPSWMLVVHP